MGLTDHIIVIFVFSFLITDTLSAPAVITTKDGFSTTSSFLDKDEEDQNSLWDEEQENEEFNFGGDVWLKEPPLPSRSTWDETDQSSSLLDDINVNKVIDDNFIGGGIDDDDESDDSPQKQKDDHQDFLLLPSPDSDEKRDEQPKVRHTGHAPLSSSAFVVNEVFDDDDDDNEDDDDDDIENYDLVPYSENNVGDDPRDLEEQLDDDKEDVFGDEDEAESKRLFEDKVFLF